MVKNLIQLQWVPDAYSGDSVNKAEALIGLNEKSKPGFVYFGNAETFNQYYASKKK